MLSGTSVRGGQFLLEDADPQTMFAPEGLSQEARLMGKSASEFLRKELLPKTDQIESHDVPLMCQLMKRAGELGFLGAEIPEEYGGLGLDHKTGAYLAENLNWQQSFALSHEAHTVIATLPLLYFGTPSQKAKYLPKLATGEWIGSFCLSEPGSGSDALGATTRADLSPDGTHYVLNGVKMWITNAGFANLFTVFAKVDGAHFSAFLVERDYPGVSFGKEEHKLGMRGTSTRQVILENVQVPVENLLGSVGKGHYAAFCALNQGRFKLEAGAIGGLKETIAQCAAYTSQRKQFDRPLGDFGLVQAKLGRMLSRTFVLESSVYRLAGLLDDVFEPIDPTGLHAPAHYHAAAEEYAIECNIVKVLGSELYSWATDEAIQIHGGYGYTEEFPVARAWRDQRLLRIGEGANEIVRIAVVNLLLKRSNTGRIELAPVFQAAKTLLAQDIPIGVPGTELINRIKIAAIVLLGACLEQFGDTVLDEQECCAAIADMVIAAYTNECAWARAKKLPPHAGTVDVSKLAREGVRAHLIETRQQARSGAELALARLSSSGMDIDQLSATLEALLRTEPIGDAISIHRSLAKAAIERGGYLW